MDHIQLVVSLIDQTLDMGVVNELARFHCRLMSNEEKIMLEMFYYIWQGPTRHNIFSINSKLRTPIFLLLSFCYLMLVSGRVLGETTIAK